MFQAVQITQDGTMTVIVDGVPYTVASSHQNYRQLKEAVRDQDSDKFVQYVDVAEHVRNYVTAQGTAKGVTFENGCVYYNGEPLHDTLTQRVVQLAREGFSVDGMLKFIDNLMSNPSSRAVNELYNFLEHKALPITEDGCFLAYKTVRSNYFDKYSGTIDNSVGQVVKMARNKVDDNHDSHCSHGLHVGALTYAGPGGWYNSASDKVMIVKVNPRDAVSVPTDHSFTKLRVCEYEVVDEYKGALNRAQYNPSDDGWYNDDDCDNNCCYDDDGDDFDLFDEMLDRLDVAEVSTGMVLTFNYHDEVRHAVVTDDTNDDWCEVILVSPEESAGQYRRFTWSDMEDIRLHNITE